MKSILLSVFAFFAFTIIGKAVPQDYYFDAKSALPYAIDNSDGKKLVGIYYSDYGFNPEYFTLCTGSSTYWNYVFGINQGVPIIPTKAENTLVTVRQNQYGWQISEPMGDEAKKNRYFQTFVIDENKELIGSCDAFTFIKNDNKLATFINNKKDETQFIFELAILNHDNGRTPNNMLGKLAWRFELSFLNKPNESYIAYIDAYDQTFTSIITDNTLDVKESEKQAFNVLVFPNPSSDLVKIQLNDENFKNKTISKIEVFSIDGREMYKAQNIMQNYIEFDCKKWQIGKYFINITIDNQTITKVFDVIK